MPRQLYRRAAQRATDLDRLLRALYSGVCDDPMVRVDSARSPRRLRPCSICVPARDRAHDPRISDKLETDMLTFWRSYSFYRRHGGRLFALRAALQWQWYMRG